MQTLDLEVNNVGELECCYGHGNIEMQISRCVAVRSVEAATSFHTSLE